MSALHPPIVPIGCNYHASQSPQQRQSKCAIPAIYLIIYQPESALKVKYVSLKLASNHAKNPLEIRSAQRK